MDTQAFLPSGINNTQEFEVVKHIDVDTVSVGSLNSLKEFQDTHQQVFFTPAVPYAWFYELGVNFDPLFSDLPDRYRKHIKRFSPLPLPVADGFYGNQAFWNNTIWTMPAELWIPFCKQMGGKGYFDTEKKLVVLFSIGVCNAEDVLAKLKGRHPGLISLAYIGVHTNKYSIVMSETMESMTLAVAKIPPDPSLKAFVDKFMKEDSAAADDLVIKPRAPLKFEQPEICTERDLTRAQRKRFIELSEFYRQVFDDRRSDPEEDDK
jgi:hypothetical protein